MRDRLVDVWLLEVADLPGFRWFGPAAAPALFVDLVEQGVLRVRPGGPGVVVTLADPDAADGEAATGLLAMLFLGGPTEVFMTRARFAATVNPLRRAGRRRATEAGLWRTAVSVPRVLVAVLGVCVVVGGLLALARASFMPTWVSPAVFAGLLFAVPLAVLQLRDWAAPRVLTPAGRAVVDELVAHIEACRADPAAAFGDRVAYGLMDEWRGGVQEPPVWAAGFAVAGSGPSGIGTDDRPVAGGAVAVPGPSGIGTDGRPVAGGAVAVPGPAEIGTDGRPDAGDAVAGPVGFENGTDGRMVAGGGADGVAADGQAVGEVLAADREATVELVRLIVQAFEYGPRSPAFDGGGGGGS
ncbi:hypothetical protein GCM10010168_36000 [Actinoplanes ianthinogenes]|uniref:TIGR04222 domain-containing membrane protein n=1 Tax=Actinoplanes ianthinogenes TaxID=122358 RepID=A0ABM7M5H9_9ACTN|nr:hypothetical protein [Actinoplanes ianthinogenes]BCJ46880.1 hypothetical protein Aiant_75370 [Actinoplanes ianthinogenes]GGR14890.1 hypothetical protein GCM10010168_36000 [Actinoplanes ianthinogenes]